MSVILACDLGGTSFRVALVDGAGRIRARHVIVMPVPVEKDGAAEIDPALWWAALHDGAAALAASHPDLFGQVEAVAISALTRSQVLVDRAGRALRPALLWRDTRAGDTLPSLQALCPPEHPETSGLNAFHPLARLWWLKQAEPAIFTEAAHVLDPKDYLNLRLTGVAASDSVSLARLTAAARPDAAGRSLFDAAALPASLLPPLNEPVSVMGHVQPGLASALGRLSGRPVIAMANDTWASVVGLGAMREGYGYNLSGTTEVLGLVSGKTARAEGLLTVEWGGGLIQLGGPSQTGADTLAWLLDLLARLNGDPARTQAELGEILAQRRDTDPVLFLPYLQGERVPYWDASLRGALIGLNRRHRAVDLAWAVMEGVGFLNRIVLERAEAAAGSAAAEIRFGGGGAANLLWCQVKADILARPIAVVEGEEHGLLGAAIVAWTALGRFADLAVAQEALVGDVRTYQPDPERGARYDRLFALFRQSEEALAPISRRLAGWRDDPLP
jgi:xylulokinase